jgi:antitoxin MazE
MRAAVRKMGNSAGIIVPKPILQELGVKAGDQLEMSFEEGKLTLAPIKRHPRLGWSQAAKKIAKSGDDRLVWPEFGNTEDEACKW